MVVPLLIFSLITGVYFSLSLIKKEPSSFVEVIQSFIFHPFNFVESHNAPLWFLFALLVCNILFIFIAKLNTKYIVCIAIGLFVFLDVTMTYEIKTWHSFYNILMGLMYYSSGYLLRKLELKNWHIAILSIIFLLCIIIYPSTIDMRFNYLMYGYFEIAVIGCITGIIIINYLFKNVPILQLKPLVYIGQNSMAYYLLHYPISWPLNFLVELFPSIFDSYECLYLDCIKLTVCLIAIPLIIKGLNRINMGWIVGMTKPNKIE